MTTIVGSFELTSVKVTEMRENVSLFHSKSVHSFNLGVAWSWSLVHEAEGESALKETEW